MATIRPRKNKYGTTYFAEIRRAGFPPKRATFDTKLEAQKWTSEIETQMRRGYFADSATGDNMLLSEALDRYKREVSAKKKGYLQEARRIDFLKQKLIAAKPITKVGMQDILKHRDERLKTVSGSTVNRELSLLSHLYRTAISEWGMEYLTNPVKDVMRPSENKSRSRRLLEGEEEKLLGNACHPKFKASLILAIETAMRRGELASLRWQDINFDDRVATLIDTKNGRERIVPLSARALETLINIRSAQSADDDFIFRMQNAIDAELIATSISSRWATLKKQTGIKGLRFHDLRREATSRLVESQKFQPHEIAAITGHSSSEIIAIYVSVDAKKLAKRL